MRVWNVNDGHPTEIRTVPTRGEMSGWPAHSPDGTQVAIVCGGPNVVIWSTQSWEEERVLEESSLSITACSCSPDGQWFATGYDNGNTRLWNARNWTRDPLLTGHRQTVKALAFSPDNRWLVTSSSDETLRIRRAPPFTETDGF